MPENVGSLLRLAAGAGCKQVKIWVGSWLREETRNRKVVSLNPSTVLYMDIFTLICCKNCVVLNRPGMAHIFNSPMVRFKGDYHWNHP